MRIAALQCNFEGGPDATLRVSDTWREIGFNVEQLFHPIAELYNSLYSEAKHRDILEAYLRRSKANGIDIILYLNCHILLPSEKDRAPQWARVTEEGEYHKLYGTYLSPCLNSPWAEHFLDTIESLKGLDIAGVFFDGPVSAPCTCAHCRTRFEGEFGNPMSQGTQRERETLQTRTFLDFSRRIYEKVKAVDPNWISYTNASLASGKWDVEETREILKCEDLLGMEGGFVFYGAAKYSPIWRCSLSSKIAEAAAGGRPTVTFVAGDQKPWSWTMHTAAETRRLYASTLGNGASVWYGIHCTTAHLSGAAGGAIREMVAFDRTHDALYQDTESAAEAAVFYCFDTAKYYSSARLESDFYEQEARSGRGIGQYRNAFEGAVATLFRSTIPFDAVTALNLDALDRYKVVLLPSAACLGEEVVVALRDYAAGGGVLIADSETSLFDTAMRKRRNFALSDVLGVDAGPTLRRQRHDFCWPAQGLLADESVDLLPSPAVGIEVAPHADTQSLIRFAESLPGRYSGRPVISERPCLTRHAFGRGFAYYLAGTWFEHYQEDALPQYGEIIETLIRRHVTFSVDVLDAPESVEVTLRRSTPGGELLVHLVNYTGGMTRPIDRPIPVSGLKLKLNRPVFRITSLTTGTDIPVNSAGIAEIPTLKNYEVLVFTNRGRS